MSFEETQSCYLDGRYFGLVLGPLYRGVVRDPIVISLREGEDGAIIDAAISGVPDVQMDVTHIIRVVVDSPHMRHSCLLIVNKSAGQCWFWNPKVSYQHIGLEMLVTKMIKQLCESIGLKFNVIKQTVPVVVPKANCTKSGFCNAFVIKFVIDWMEGRSFDPYNILRFCADVERQYSGMLVGDADIEYDVEFSPIGGLVGLGGGALIGGAIGGAPGALVGGLGGLAIGGLVGGNL
jgi:hypothetical protein